jgi:glucose/arabinose dehydrogenase
MQPKASRTSMYQLLLIPFLLITASGPLEGCSANASQDPIDSEVKSVALVAAFPALSFRRPLDLKAAPGQPLYLYVVEQAGQVSVFENRSDVKSKSRILDIDSRVDDSSNEMGLLGLAFHPDFEQNGFLFLNYTAGNPRRTVIARYSADPADPTAPINPGSEHIVMEIPQPYGNHNGGGVAFGPDGYLYIGMGDGGAGGDPQENGQNTGTLLGAMLRIDVDNTSGSRQYAIPPDNPFVGQSNARPEIWAYGLRNPWRFSFDESTGRLWAGDVGQNNVEEIDILEAGMNYGWNTMEASRCFDPKTDCDQSGLVLPVAEHDRREASSITGGYVYRGSAVPDLVGLYVYADYVTGRIWALSDNGDGSFDGEQLFDTELAIASFGVDGNRELYVCAFDGHIYKFVNSSE